MSGKRFQLRSTSKYAIGQKVWMIRNNKVIEGEIRSIKLKELVMSYQGTFPEPEFSYWIADSGDWNEKHLYPSKEELLTSL